MYNLSVLGHKGYVGQGAGKLVVGHPNGGAGVGGGSQNIRNQGGEGGGGGGAGNALNPKVKKRAGKLKRQKK